MGGRRGETRASFLTIDCNGRITVRATIYLIEKSTGLTDENGVELYYAVAARLTRQAAETEFAEEIEKGARVRKLVATK